MTSTVRLADGGLVIRHACPAGIEALSAAEAGDGRWFVLSGGGRTACWWPVDAEDVTDAPRHAFRSLATVESMALARLPGGNDVVVALTGDGQLLRWDRASGKSAGQPVEHPLLGTYRPGQMFVIANTGSGPVAVKATSYQGLRRWDVSTGRKMGEVLGPESGAVCALAAGTYPDGSPVVVSGSVDGLLHRWDPVTGAERGEPIRGCGRAVAIAITRLAGGQSVLCVLSAKGNVHRRDLVTGEPLGKRIGTAGEPGKAATVCRGALAVVATGDRAVIATCTDQRSVRLWDLVSGAPAGELTGFAGAKVGCLAAAYLPDGTPLILVGDGDGNVHRFDARTRRPTLAPLQPHGQSACTVLPITAADGRIILAVHPNGKRWFDARTGEAIGEREVPLGGRYPGTATLPGGRTVTAEVRWDGRVCRRDAVTGEMIGEPQAGHRSWGLAITTARQADGSPMFISGCEAGDVLRWDAESGKRIGPPLAKNLRMVVDLKVVDLPGGRQILAGVDGDNLFRWDPVTGESVGRPVRAGTQTRIVATYVHRSGTPTAFVYVSGEYDDEQEGVHWWRLDTGTRMETEVPNTLRAVFDDAGTTWMALSEPDGSIAIRPLPTSELDWLSNQLSLW